MKVLKYIVCVALALGFIGVASTASAQVSIPLSPQICCTGSSSEDPGACVNQAAQMDIGVCVYVAGEGFSCVLTPPFKKLDRLPGCGIQEMPNPTDPR